MYEAAVFTAKKKEAATHGLKFKPLSAEARAIAGELPALNETQEDEAVVTNLGGDLEEEVHAGGGVQGTHIVQVGGVKHSPYSVTKRTTGGIDLPGGATSKGTGEKKPASSAQGDSKGAAAEQVEDAAGADGVAAKAGTAPMRGKVPVFQPTPSTGMKRPDGAPAPSLDIGRRDQLGYGRSTPTDHAKPAYSPQQTEDKARLPTAELTGMHVKYKTTVQQPLPVGIIRPAEAVDLGPSTVNCIRGALGA